jgi:hypothetical protein
MFDGLRHVASVSSAARKPLSVWVKATGLCPDVRGMRTPSAYNWRVRRLDGTGAIHTLESLDVGCHPVTGTPPLTTGRPEPCASHTTR